MNTLFDRAELRITDGLPTDVVNEIIAAHQGRIKVDSKPGLTRFSLFLPLPRTKKS